MRRSLTLCWLALVSGCNCSKPVGLLETSGILVVNPDALEFGAVTEFSTVKKTVTLQNAGRGALSIAVGLEDGTSADFTLGSAPAELAAGAKVEVEVTFSPLGAGEDLGAIIVSSDEPDRAPTRVPLHGGRIGPQLAFEPDPLAFAPAASFLVSKLATLRNVGGSTLRVSAIGVSPLGNPDFSVTPPMLPLTLAPDASVPVSVSYARSVNAADGALEVVSDDPIDGGVRSLRLLPDPSHVCGDGLDNDSDGLTDFPDDPGCSSADDADEYNPPECVTGGTQPCGSMVGSCRQGTRVCANSIWGACDGGVRPASEACNGLDDDCNGMSDENLSELCTINSCPGARACIANSGVDGGSYTACIAISSMPEQCNGVDDNCNGQVDEGVVQSCTVFGCAGVRICVPGGDGGFTSCMPANPQPETCNGMDDDCNGQIDELPDLACGLGQCRRVVPACVNGANGTCTPGPMAAEVCNGVDDNCNGTIDDGVMPLTCGVGACTNSVPACMLNGSPNTCTPNAPAAELCNNVDDNCNGVKDEQADGGALARSCYSGAAATRTIGRCRDGTQTCAAGSYPAGCSGEVLPTAESCNTIDDNCNGLSDEQADGGAMTQGCYTGTAGTRNVGRCRDGVQTCTSGAFGGCMGSVLPAASETCANSIDDNCNGQVDEGCAGCSVNGTWRVDGGTVAYSCAIGLVNIGMDRINLALNTPVTLQMTGLPQPTWSPVTPSFAPVPLTGSNATCPTGPMDISGVATGDCTETYRLQGNFTTANDFVGTMTMTFTPAYGGACFDCVNQTRPVQLFR